MRRWLPWTVSLVALAGLALLVCAATGVGGGREGRARQGHKEQDADQRAPRLTLAGVERSRRADRRPGGAGEDAAVEDGAAARRGPLELVMIGRQRPLEGVQVGLRLEPDAAQPMHVRTTDDQGRVSFQDTELPEVVVVEALAEGFVPYLEEHDAYGKQSVELDAGVPYKGRVLNAGTGAPIPGAEVAFDDVAGPHLGPTDADGSFHVPGAEDEARHVLVVSAAGYARAVVEVHIQDRKPTAPVLVRLEPARAIAGRVSRPDGTPAEGATVLGVPDEEYGDVEPPPEEGERYGSSIERFEYDDDITDWRVDPVGHVHKTIVGADGRFRVGALSAATRYTVHAEAPGYADARAERSVRAVLPERERDLTLVLRPWSVSRVRVVVPGELDLPVRVRAFQGEIPRIPEAVKDGRYLIPVAPGAAYAFAQAPSCLSAKQWIDVPEGGTVDVDLVLGMPATVHGTVVDPDGNPVHGARVRVAALRQNDDDRGTRKLYFEQATNSSSDGAFTVGGLPNEQVVLLAEWPQHGGAVMGCERLVFKAPARDVRVVLRHRGAVRARLLSAGAPFVGRVRYELSQAAGTWAWRETDVDDGLLVVGELREGRHVLALHPSGHARVERTISVTSGATVDVRDIALETGVTVRGRVVDDSGRPLSGVRVRGAGRETRSDVDGRFALEHCPSEPFRLTGELSAPVLGGLVVDPSRSAEVELVIIDWR